MENGNIMKQKMYIKLLLIKRVSIEVHNCQLHNVIICDCFSHWDECLPWKFSNQFSPQNFSYSFMEKKMTQSETKKWIIFPFLPFFLARLEKRNGTLFHYFQVYNFSLHNRIEVLLSSLLQLVMNCRNIYRKGKLNESLIGNFDCEIF